MDDLTEKIILILIVWAIYRYLTRSRYRIVMVDPVTGYYRYLSGMDGIGGVFSYTNDPDDALIFGSRDYAARYLKEIDQRVNPRLEVKKLLGWYFVN